MPRLRKCVQVVSNPDADHIGGFLDVFDAFDVETVYLSGDPKGKLSYNSFLRRVREEGSEVEEVRAGYRMDWGGCGRTREHENTQSLELRFRAWLSEGSAKVLFHRERSDR